MRREAPSVAKHDASEPRGPAFGGRSVSLLEVTGLEAGYGSAQVLFGVSLSVAEGEVATLIGRNGMGKTTTVRAIMGLLKPRGGHVRIAGEDLTGAPPYRVGRAGVGLVPEGRQVFPTLTVEENLLATSRPGMDGRWRLGEVYGFFPRLAERRRNLGGQLSGGEQQMLAIGRALMTNPRLLVLDEATEGLAPLVRQEIWDRLADLKREGLSILVIDKNLDALGRIADRHHVLEKGEIVWSGRAGEPGSDAASLERHLHL
jgi:branched-chain amino acid transport system ATP-binding protein